uniref:Uncharacterized protein n=1 Tax=Anguilla anguilla TaxID=7936 RepID=A0A0E9WXA6_ANGAN
MKVYQKILFKPNVISSIKCSIQIMKPFRTCNDYEWSVPSFCVSVHLNLRFICCPN